MNYFRKALVHNPSGNSFQRVVSDKRFVAIKAFLNLHKSKQQTSIDGSLDSQHFFFNIAAVRLTTFKYIFYATVYAVYILYGYCSIHHYLEML